MTKFSTTRLGINLFRHSVLIVLLISLVQSTLAQTKITKEDLNKHKGVKEEFMQRRAEAIAQLRGVTKDQPFDPAKRLAAVQLMERQRAERASAGRAMPDAVWTEIGPNPIPNGQVAAGPQLAVSGRTIAIAVHPTNADIVYVGTAQGGLYRSTNGGTSWTPLMDNALSLAIGVISISPSSPETIYVGTGEPNFSSDSYFGVGVYRIDNASSASPTITGPLNDDASNADIFTGRAISQICVHPTNPAIIFVSTASGIGGIGATANSSLPSRGIYRSTDATSADPTFTKLTGLEGGGNFSVRDMVLDPLNPNLMVCNLVANGGGIYVSTDALSPSPTFVRNATFSNTSTSELTAEFAIQHTTGPNPTIYAATGNGGGRVLMSVDGGTTWTQQIDNNFCTPQCFYDIAVAVDPTDATRVYLGGAPALVFGVSTNSGVSFTNNATTASGLHVDSHVIGVSLSTPSTIYFGSDGGIYKSTNSGSTWTSLNNSTFRATQFMGLAVHPSDPNYTIGGTQDNGTNMYRPDASWNRVDFGDGGYAVIDQNAANTTTVDMYHTYFNNSSLQGYGTVSTTAGAVEGGWTFRGCNTVAGNGIPCGGAVLFYAPLEQGPGNPNSIYYGANILYRSADKGLNHTAVSQNLTNPISAIGISPQNDNVRIVGTNLGGLFGTTTGNNVLTDLDAGNNIPNNFIARTVIDPQNVNTAYVTISAFGVVNIWKTTNLNAANPTWTAITSGIPQVPVNAFVVDHTNSNNLYAGTDIGVYASSNGGTTWSPLGTALPIVAVFDIAITAGSKLRIATHGRGMWEHPVILTAAPTVTINQAGAQPDPTSISPINFTAVFSEDVIGFATGDVTLGGTAGATTATVTGGPATYNVAVSGMTGSGTVIASINAGVATGTINVLGNTASTSTDNTVTYNAAAPVVLTCPTNTTTAACQTQTAVNAAFATWLATASGSGGCSGVLTNNNSGTPPACGGSTTVTFTYTSTCAPLTTTCQATFTVAAPPTVVLTCPVNTTVTACQTQAAVNAQFAAWLATATGSGGCNGVLTNNNTGAPSACGGSTTVTFTYTSTCAPLTTTCQATFTVAAPPTVVLTCPVNTSVAACQTQAAVNAQFAAWLATATGSGGCNGVLTNNNTGAPSACGGSTTVTFTYTSTCAPLTTTCQATFTVAAPPTVVLTCPINTTETSGQTQAAVNAAFASWLATASGSGGCNGVLTNNNTGAPAATGGSTTVTFTYTSSCAPITTTCQSTFTVSVPTAPVNDNCINATLLSCGGSATGSTATATIDGPATSCNGLSIAADVWYRIVGTGSNITASLCGSGYDTKIEIYTGTCGAFTCIANNDDFCGTSSQVTWSSTLSTNYFIRVHGFNGQTGNYSLNITCPCPPVTLTCPVNTTVTACQTQAAVNAQFAAWLATASGSGGENGVLTNNNTGAPSSCGGSTTVTFTYTSTCAPLTTTCQATFTVAAPPTVVLTCPTNTTATACQTQAAVNAQFAAWLATASASGGCNGVLTNNNTGSPSACGGSTTVTFTYTSTCAPLTTTCQATFTVAAPPIIVLTCPTNTTVAACQTQAAVDVQFATWLATASGTGGCSGVLTNNNTGAPSACGGSTTVTFTYTSTCAPLTTTCQATFTVTAPPPVILTCPVNTTVTACQTQAAVDAAFATWLATASSTGGCNGVLTNNNTGAPSACGGSTTVTFTYTSNCAPLSTTCQATFTVTAPPPITLTCPAPVTVSCSGEVPAPNIASVTVNSGCGVVVTHQGDVISNQTCTNRFTITRTYRATDGCGNFTECTQIITVNDITPPSISCPAPITVSCAAAVPVPNVNLVTASDNCGGSLAPVVTFVNDVISNQTCANRYTITRTYRATDVCGNFAECTQTITVNDVTPPTLTCPAPVTVSCASAVPAPNIASVTGVSDNCAGVVTVTHVSDVISAQTCANRYTITRTYRATDVCGNFTQCTQIITVNDQTPPVITCPAPVTVSCASAVPAANISAVTATDNCGGTITITHVGDVISAQTCANRYTITRTYRATDVCGNTATCTQIITVNDQTAPVITCPANITVTTPVGSCTAVVSFAPTATDNCGTVTIVNSPASGTAFAIGTTTVTSTATDACGNSSSCTFTVIVLDGQLPVISAQPANRTVCTGTNATFSVTATNAVTYQWQQSTNGTAFSNITGATGATLTLTNVTRSMNTNSYRVLVNGLCTVVTSNHASLYVNPLPDVALTASPVSAILPTQTTSIIATTKPSGGSFVWYRNNVVVPGVTGPIFGPITIDGIGVYRTVYTDPNGCINTSANLVITAQPSDNMWVYPNPNTGQFNVRYYNQTGETATLKVFDYLGQEVFKQALPQGIAYSNTVVNIPKAAAEVYIVRVVTSNGRELAATRIVVYH